MEWRIGETEGSERAEQTLMIVMMRVVRHRVVSKPNNLHRNIKLGRGGVQGQGEGQRLLGIKAVNG